MAVLTTKARHAIPATKFAGPDRSYPIPDKAHAANAKARAAEFASPALKAKIDAKANKVLKAAGGADPQSPGQTVTNGSWTGPGSASAPNPSPNPGNDAAFQMRAKMQGGKIAAAGGCSGLDTAMMAHADKMHPVPKRG